MLVLYRDITSVNDFSLIDALSNFKKLSHMSHKSKNIWRVSHKTIPACIVDEPDMHCERKSPIISKKASEEESGIKENKVMKNF